MRKTVLPMITALALLAGCGGSPPAPGPDPSVIMEAQRREADAIQLADRERARREFWQGAAYTAGVAAVILLIAGTAIGSRTRHDATKS